MQWALRYRVWFLWTMLGLGCTGVRSPQPADVCANYPSNNQSPYVLPYRQGESHGIIQGNCAAQEPPWTHFGNLRYAYDFQMPIGTLVLASRKGTVVFVRDNFTDDDHGKEQGNGIVILHEDGTYALYGHLTNKGALVKVGQVVQQGETIGRSGNSGESPVPHLHFQVSACGDFTRCPSLPLSFTNVLPAAERLEKGVSYEAQ